MQHKNKQLLYKTLLCIMNGNGVTEEKRWYETRCTKHRPTTKLYKYPISVFNKRGFQAQGQYTLGNTVGSQVIDIISKYTYMDLIFRAVFLDLTF